MPLRIVIAMLFLFAQLSMSWAMPVHDDAGGMASMRAAGCHAEPGGPHFNGPEHDGSQHDDPQHDDCQLCAACGFFVLFETTAPALVPAMTGLVAATAVPAAGVRAPPYRPPICS